MHLYTPRHKHTQTGGQEKRGMGLFYDLTSPMHMVHVVVGGGSVTMDPLQCQTVTVRGQ